MRNVQKKSDVFQVCEGNFVAGARRTRAAAPRPRGGRRRGERYVRDYRYRGTINYERPLITSDGYRVLTVTPSSLVSNVSCASDAKKLMPKFENKPEKSISKKLILGPPWFPKSLPKSVQNQRNHFQN